MAQRIKASAVPLVAVFIGIFAALLFAEPSQWDTDIAALGSSNPATREAARERIESGGSTNVSALLTELEDTDHSVLAKSEMVTAITNIGPTTAQLSSAKSLLDDPSPAVRHAALRLLALKPTTYRKTFLTVMEDENEVDATRAAAAILAGYGGADSRARLLVAMRDEEHSQALRTGAMRGLALASSDGAADVGGVAEDDTAPFWQRKAALAALGHEDAHGEDELVSLMTSPWPWIRAEATVALGRLGETDQVAKVVLRLKDAADVVRKAAITSLVLMDQDDDKRTDIEKLVKDANVHVAVAALRVVQEHCRDRKDQMATTLKGILTHKDFLRRYHASLALYHMGDGSGLTTMKADKKSTNATEAAMATAAVDLMTNGGN